MSVSLVAYRSSLLPSAQMLRAQITPLSAVSPVSLTVPWAIANHALGKVFPSKLTVLVGSAQLVVEYQSEFVVSLLAMISCSGLVPHSGVVCGLMDGLVQS